MSLSLPFLTKDNTNTATRNPIQEFVSQVKGNGIARTNRYTVLFTPPAGVSPAALQKVLLFCDQVQLPGANFSTVQNRTFGEFREVPYEKIYDNITMSFYVDTNMEVKRLFDSWQNQISNPITRTYNYYKNYITNMEIEVQDINNKTRYAVTLFECYPKSISSVQLDYASKDVMKLQVGMQYKYWTVSPVAELANGEKVPTNWYDKMMQNFSGFQQTMNETLGPQLGNFITGSAGSLAVSKLPGILKF